MTPTAKQKKMFEAARQGRAERRMLQILVVEDQPFLRKMLQQILAEEHQVESAAGVTDGWNLYIRKAPDVVFLDIGLEDGDGHALAHAIKQFDPEAYVVMTTVYNQKEEVQAAMYNRVDGYVVKPYSRQQISGYIDKFVNARKMQTQTVVHA